jgi:hypothetical protein
VGEGCAAGEASEKIDRHGEDAEDQYFRGKPDLVGRKSERRQCRCE